MPLELFANAANPTTARATTLAAAMLAGDTSLTVVSSTGIPVAVVGVSQTRILVESEVVTVQNVNVGTNVWSSLLRGQEGTAAVAHPLGATVSATITAGALENKTLTTTTQTGLTYTLALADGSTIVEMNNAAANTLTVPPNSAAAFPLGIVVSLRQYGAGQTTIAAGVGVTIRSRGAALKLNAQYSEASIVKRGADEWVLTGDVVV